MIYYSLIQLLIYYLYTAQTNHNIKIIKVVNVGMKLLLKLNHSEFMNGLDRKQINDMNLWKGGR